SGPVADSPHRGCNLRTLYPAGPPCPTRTQGRPAPKIRRQQVQETQCHRTRLRPPEAMARTGHQVRQARYRLQSRRRSQRQRCLATTFVRHALDCGSSEGRNMSDNLPPAGWYPDGHGVKRYWDGTGWTERVQPEQFQYDAGSAEEAGSEEPEPRSAKSQTESKVKKFF